MFASDLSVMSSSIMVKPLNNLIDGDLTSVMSTHVEFDPWVALQSDQTLTVLEVIIYRVGKFTIVLSSNDKARERTACQQAAQKAASRVL